jgi:hypothetical protein
MPSVAPPSRPTLHVARIGRWDPASRLAGRPATLGCWPWRSPAGNALAASGLRTGCRGSPSSKVPPALNRAAGLRPLVIQSATAGPWPPIRDRPDTLPRFNRHRHRHRNSPGSPLRRAGACNSSSSGVSVVTLNGSSRRLTSAARKSRTASCVSDPISRQTLTRVSRRSTHFTGISQIRYPRLSANTSSSVSKNQPLSSTMGKSFAAASCRIALNPHCPSTNRSAPFSH